MPPISIHAVRTVMFPFDTLCLQMKSLIAEKVSTFALHTLHLLMLC